MQDWPGQSEISQGRRETKGLGGRQAREADMASWFSEAGSNQGSERGRWAAAQRWARAGGEAEKSPVQFRGTKCCVVGLANSLLSPSRASSVQHPLLRDGREQ